jgi:hypothetical protein
MFKHLQLFIRLFITVSLVPSTSFGAENLRSRRDLTSRPMVEQAVFHMEALQPAGVPYTASNPFSPTTSKSIFHELVARLHNLGGMAEEFGMPSQDDSDKTGGLPGRRRARDGDTPKMPSDSSSMDRYSFRVDTLYSFDDPSFQSPHQILMRLAIHETTVEWCKIINSLSSGDAERVAQGMAEFTAFEKKTNRVIHKYRGSFDEISFKKIRAALENANHIFRQPYPPTPLRLIELFNELNAAYFLAYGGSWIEAQETEKQVSCVEIDVRAWGWTIIEGRPIRILLYQGDENRKGSRYKAKQQMVMLDVNQIRESVSQEFQIWKGIRIKQNIPEDYSMSPSPYMPEELAYEEALKDVVWHSLIEEFGHAEDDLKYERKETSVIVKENSPLAEYLREQPISFRKTTILEIKAFLRRIIFSKNLPALIYAFQDIRFFAESDHSRYSPAAKFIWDAIISLITPEMDLSLKRLLRISMPTWRIFANTFHLKNFELSSQEHFHAKLSEDGTAFVQRLPSGKDLRPRLSEDGTRISGAPPFFQAVLDFVIPHSIHRLTSHPAAEPTIEENSKEKFQTKAEKIAFLKLADQKGLLLDYTAIQSEIQRATPLGQEVFRLFGSIARGIYGKEYPKGYWKELLREAGFDPSKIRSRRRRSSKYSYRSLIELIQAADAAGLKFHVRQMRAAFKQGSPIAVGLLRGYNAFQKAARDGHPFKSSWREMVSAA